MLGAPALVVGLLAVTLHVGSCGTVEDPCQLGYRRDPGTGLCTPCPSCFQEVAQEYNETVELYQELLDRLNTTAEGGLSRELLAQLIQYEQTLTELLETAVNVTDREPQLLEDVQRAFTEAQGYEDSINEFGVNVSAAENATASLVTQTNDTLSLLMELQRLVHGIEETLQVEVHSLLGEADRLYQEYLVEFDNLVQYSTQANITASEQYSLASNLLSLAKQALNQSREAFNLLCRAIALQEETTTTLERLETFNLPTLSQLYEDARQALLRAESLVPLAVNQSKIALEEINNIFITLYNTTSLDREVDKLSERTETVSQSTAALDSELNTLSEEFSSLNDNASRLLNESKELRNKAIVILSVVHAANTLASVQVNTTQELFDRANGILVELQRRLNETESFTAGLEELLRNIELAESSSLEAEDRTLLSAEEVRNATRVAEEAARQLDEVEVFLMQAVEAAIQANSTITELLSNATSLNDTSHELASDARATDKHIGSLEVQARVDRENIVEAQTNAQEAITTAEEALRKIQDLQRIIRGLAEELEATQLLPPGRITEVEGVLVGLEVQADENQVVIDLLTEQVEELQESSRQLRERYRDLQRHNDLLQEILDSIEPLDCTRQFSTGT